MLSLLPGLAVSFHAGASPRPAVHRAHHRTSDVAMAAPGGRRVVVTGMGIVSCLGNSLDDVSASLKEAKSGIKVNQKYIDIGMKSHICGRPEIDLDEFIDRKQARFMGINAKYAFVAMQQAIDDSCLPPEAIDSDRCGGILGQGGTSLADVQETMQAVEDRKLRRIGPYRVTRSMGSTVSAVLSTSFKLKGASYSISSACSTGAHCIGVGMEQIQLNKADVMFCGAGEAEDWGFSVMFDAMTALSTKYNDDPTTASRAFDVSRDGFVIAGGGGIIARGAKIYGELVGYAANSDGYDMVAPSGIGGQNCMRLAMKMANEVGGEKQIDYVNTHGTSTPVGDLKELDAIKTVFTEAGYQPHVGSTKSLSGHALGAAGVHEAIYSLLMMRDGFLAESANIKELVPEAEGMNILRKREEMPVQRVMSNSFGFGGTNACLIFDKYD
ncbi:3-oxoacyl-synthase [Emiliania huxleyi CCMP1516]|uniref:Nodulation protein E n=2 Tax=Emiliania huxleyi TaxID=2903 RepID=A0A0D3I229_EMIH1|nr:3-oxoacyl-synthase [Emiliania huxleyi CCMP1516]EOD05314.1 3-oxoacyl-synthase [Emiliania huxleyi CCMP1516]|eukprot:XP_005757743.1 3-oxoacyl-synthase [Emiliania huxleyi CCMP1516]